MSLAPVAPLWQARFCSSFSMIALERRLNLAVDSLQEGQVALLEKSLDFTQGETDNDDVLHQNWQILLIFM